MSDHNNRTLGLRRHTGGYSSVPFGLHRDPHKAAKFSSMPRPAPKEEAPEVPTPEFIEPAKETDAVFAGMGSLNPEPAKPERVEQPEDEMPMGHYRAPNGDEFIDRVPAFLMRARPVSNIR